MMKHAATFGQTRNKPNKMNASLEKQCVYCLANDILRDDQVLIRGDYSYVAAPLGQLAGGFLTIAPYGCGSSLSQLPPHALDEIIELQALLATFYKNEYNCTNPTFYEQGRAGGGTRVDRQGHFPLHAHLCGLPEPCDLHKILSSEFVCIGIEQLTDLSSAVANQPYIYANTTSRHRVYVGKSIDSQRQLETSRIKPQIAKLLGLTDSGDWRDYPGESELNVLLTRFERFLKRSQYLFQAKQCSNHTKGRQ